MGKKKKSSYASDENVIDFEQAQEARRQKRKERLQKKAPSEKDIITQRRQAKRRRFVIICSVVLILVATLVASACIKLWKLNKEKKEADAELNTLKQEQAALENELSQIQSDEYIEQAARAELHMIIPGETMYVIPIEDTTDSAITQEDESEAKP